MLSGARLRCDTLPTPLTCGCIGPTRLYQGGDEIARTARNEIQSRRQVPSAQVDKLVADGHAYVVSGVHFSPDVLLRQQSCL